MAKAVAQLRFDYTSLDEPTRRFVVDRTETVHNMARTTATAIVQIGKALAEVKEKLGHGKFLDWIEKEFAWSQPTAWRFMNVYEQFKLSNLNNLSIDVSALYQIAAPSTPEPVRRHLIARAENGERITHQGMRALVQQFAETGKLPEVEVDLRQMIEDRRKMLPAPEFEPEPEPRLSKQQLLEMKEQMRINSEHNAAVWEVIKAMECLAAPPLPMNDIAEFVQCFDAPNKNWAAQPPKAIETLKQLIKELKQ